MSDTKALIPPYYAKLLQDSLYPNLYFMGNAHWSMTPKQRVKANWKLYDPWFRNFLKTTFGRKLEIPDWTLAKAYQGEVGSMFGFKVFQSNATKVSIPKLK